MGSNLVKSIVNKAFRQINKSKRSVQIPIYSASIGRIGMTNLTIEANSAGIVYPGSAAKSLHVQMKKSSANKTKMLLTKEQALVYAEIIDDLHVGANHLNVKEDYRWRLLYLYQERPMVFEAPDGAGKIKKNLESIPCHHCGIIMPADTIQVDHYMPQAQSPDLYAIKTLRALGMTMEKATGWKGYNFDAASSTYGLKFKVYPAGRERGNMIHLQSGTSGQKWTTNPRGNAFLSLMAQSGDLDSFRRLCKNSLLNLVPLCSHCNQRKSNLIRGIV